VWVTCCMLTRRDASKIMPLIPAAVDPGRIGRRTQGSSSRTQVVLPGAWATCRRRVPHTSAAVRGTQAGGFRGTSLPWPGEWPGDPQAPGAARTSPPTRRRTHRHPRPRRMCPRYAHPSRSTDPLIGDTTGPAAVPPARGPSAGGHRHAPRGGRPRCRPPGSAPDADGLGGRRLPCREAPQERCRPRTEARVYGVGGVAGLTMAQAGPGELGRTPTPIAYARQNRPCCRQPVRGDPAGMRPGTYAATDAKTLTPGVRNSVPRPVPGPRARREDRPCHLARKGSGGHVPGSSAPLHCGQRTPSPKAG
jgi:hypothetical protein